MPPTRKGPLLVIFLTVFIDLLGFGMVLPLLPIYGKQFALQYGLSETEKGWVLGLLMASFSAMQFLFAPLWGRLSDRVGRRPVLMVGLAGSVVFYALFGIATQQQSLLWLFVARIGAGIAGATISTAQAYIADSTALAGRTKGMALIGAAFGLGFTFGPLFGALALPRAAEGAVAAELGPGPGYAAAALSAVALALAAFVLPESLKEPQAGKARGWFSLDALSDALAVPSVGLLILTSFVSVLSFANFESTLSLLLQDETGAFRFDLHKVLYTFAYVGFTLMLVQGGIVRRLSGRVADAHLAAAGAVLMIAGFCLLSGAAGAGSRGLLYVALFVTVSGFACTTPALNSLISRRSDPAKQGSVLGLAQSASALARILGPLIGMRLFHLYPDRHTPQTPLWVAAGLMAVCLALILAAARRGRDFPAAA